MSKYLGSMVTQVMVKNDFIKPEQAPEIQADFDKKMNESRKSESRFNKFINSFLDHPLGALGAVFGVALITRLLKRYNREDVEQDQDHAFESQYKSLLYQKMINDLGSKNE